MVTSEKVMLRCLLSFGFVDADVHGDIGVDDDVGDDDRFGDPGRRLGQSLGVWSMLGHGRLRIGLHSVTSCGGDKRWDGRSFLLAWSCSSSLS
mmetsp:Transcript_18055/g.26345  ORF Transcript_18055/g.26345 Transcript_18055/m.26345 type:complete len:93 (-) Transcript_18055:194-472(-)